MQGREADTVGRYNHFKKLRNNRVWKKTGGVCAHCGKKATGLSKTIDHYIPKSWGGGFDERNLMPLCRKCNMKRMNRRVKAYDYYIYAPMWIIEMCEEYEREWYLCRRQITQR